MVALAWTSPKFNVGEMSALVRSVLAALSSPVAVSSAPTAFRPVVPKVPNDRAAPICSTGVGVAVGAGEAEGAADDAAEGPGDGSPSASSPQRESIIAATPAATNVDRTLTTSLYLRECRWSE